MKQFTTALCVIALAALGGGCGDDGGGGGGADAGIVEPQLVVASTREVGNVEKPATVAGRDGAQTAVLDGKLLWIFGDTFFATQSVDGVNYRTTTATIASVEAPLATTEPLDANGVPLAALPWTPEEVQYNAMSGSATDRVALWTAGLVPDVAAASILGFYEKIYLKPSGWESAGIGTARFAAGATVGVRTPGLLFDYVGGEPLFKTALLDGDEVYLYGALRTSTGGGVAKAPLAAATDRSAYTFWTGSAWSTDVAEAGRIGAPGDLSVAWNEYLGVFVGVSSPFGSNRIEVRTAPRPEGPWSSGKTLFATRQGANDQSTYVAELHPELTKEGGKTIAVSYSLPTDCFLCGEVVLVEVTFE